MYKSHYQSPIGLIEITASDSGLLSVSFRDETEEINTIASANDITKQTAEYLVEYFAGNCQTFDVPLAPVGTAFQQQVWKELVKVPFGKTDTYSSIANKLNNPLSVRAVGAANGKNPIAIIVPCHRIIGASGHLTGYAGGLWRKEFLLNLEGASKGVQAKLW
ncbi:MAG: methylated-DNA--[protein]-cysteine S-methyltransferase [Taibaiella sp.]|jgi:methylated-DNA-[protein]-cysteine S-methyltransferase